MIGIYVFIVGIVMGSFYNAVIYRIPNDIPISKGRSICPTCKHELHAIDLVPFLSWAFLRAKCRYCKTKISWRYPFFELLMGVIFLGCYFIVAKNYNPDSSNILKAVFELLLYFSFFSMLLITTMIDYDYMIVSLNVLGISSFISLISLIIINYPKLGNLGNNFLGAFLGAVIYLLVYAFAMAVFKKEAFGMGDVYLLAAIGLVVGTRDVVLVAFGSFFIGLLFIILGQIIGKKLKMKQEIPFGPYICITAVIILFFGDKLVNMYLSYL